MVVDFEMENDEARPGEPRPAFDNPSRDNSRFDTYRLARDGRVLVALTGVFTSVQVVLNWYTELAAAVGAGGAN